MKIKTVCEKTRLTDRTVRYYIEEGLISPSFTENYLGRKSFDFSEDDVSQLRDIAVLRSFDFSIEEIKELLRTPDRSLEIIKAVKDRIRGEVLTNQKKLSTLSLLNDQTRYTVSEIAKQLSKPGEVTPAKEEVGAKFLLRVVSAIKGILSFLVVWLHVAISISIISISFVRYEHPIVNPLFLGIVLLLFLPSLFCMLSPKIKSFQHRIVKGVLFVLCLVCIPISIFVSLSAVEECPHRWIEITKEAASCARNGSVVKKCDLCRDVVVNMQERLPHTVVIDRGSEASCSDEGLSDGSHCSVCQTVIVSQQTIPKKDHTYVKSLVESTCTEEGQVLLTCSCGDCYKQQVIPKKDHDYDKNYVKPTCNKEGYTLFTCSCGDTYKDNVLAATEAHNFKKNGESGYFCALCSLEVCSYGFIDGSGYESSVKYYITGNNNQVTEQERTLVIYGKGKMPSCMEYSPLYELIPQYPWHNNSYAEEITTVIIGEGVTSIGKGAFSGSVAGDSFPGNPFHSVKCFTIKGNTLTVDPQSPDISGIECDITYVP